MDEKNGNSKFSRTPTIKDLLKLCKNLNKHNVKYVVIGGFAVIHYGYIKGTGDIDLLIDSSKENIKRIKKALLYLPDKAVNEMNDTDIEKYNVVRIADEIVIDLLIKACEVTYNLASQHIEYQKIKRVQIPYLSLPLLIKTKLSLRAKDKDDKIFLENLLEFKKRKTK